MSYTSIPNDTRQAAADCLQLEWKYFNIIGCVKGQRPELMSDPELAKLAAEADAAVTAFRARLETIAGPLDFDSGEPV